MTHWHPPRSLGTGKQPSRSSDAGWHFTGCPYFGSSLHLPSSPFFVSVCLPATNIFILNSKATRTFLQWKKSTKKSPAYGRGFKANFSVNFSSRPGGSFSLSDKWLIPRNNTWLNSFCKITDGAFYELFSSYIMIYSCFTIELRQAFFAMKVF